MGSAFCGGDKNDENQQPNEKELNPQRVAQLYNNMERNGKEVQLKVKVSKPEKEENKNKSSELGKIGVEVNGVKQSQINIYVPESIFENEKKEDEYNSKMKYSQIRQGGNIKYNWKDKQLDKIIEQEESNQDMSNIHNNYCPKEETKGKQNQVQDMEGIKNPYRFNITTPLHKPVPYKEENPMEMGSSNLPQNLYDHGFTVRNSDNGKNQSGLKEINGSCLKSIHSSELSTNQNSKNKKCKKCNDGKVTHACIPQGHFSLCRNCAGGKTFCLLCKQERQFIQIKLSC